MEKKKERLVCLFFYTRSKNKVFLASSVLIKNENLVLASSVRMYVFYGMCGDDSNKSVLKETATHNKQICFVVI